MLIRVVCAVLAGSWFWALEAQVVTVGGASPDYTSLPQAVAAVAPNTIVLVRPGKHTGFTTNKPLRIHLDFSAQGGSIVPAPGALYAITIDGMPANGSFTLTGDGAEVEAGALGAVRIANTAGRVVVGGITVAAGATATAIDVQNAGPVLLQDSELAGTPGLQIQTATVATNNVRVSSPAGHAVAAFHGLLDFAGGGYSGRDQSALYLVNCDIRLAGDGATPIKVGGSSPMPVSAFEVIHGLVMWQPSRFTVEPANGAPAFAAGGTTVVVTEDPPIMRAQGGPPGANAWLHLTNHTAMPGMVVVGPFVPPVFLGLAGLYLNLGQPFATPLIGLVDAAGLKLTFVVPATPALLGDVSCVQGAVFSPSGLPTLSGPVALVTL